MSCLATYGGLTLVGQNDTQDRALFGLMPKIAGAVAAVCLSATASHAVAHATPGAPAPVQPGTSTGVQPTSLALQVGGEIRSRCALGSGSAVDLGNLSYPQEVMVSVGLSCNVPFVLRLQAVNGDLLHRTLPNGQGGYSGRVMYGVDVSVPLLSPRPGQMGAQFKGRELRGGVSLDSADSIAEGGATLKFFTHGQEYSALAGEYTETITMTIVPKM